MALSWKCTSLLATPFFLHILKYGIPSEEKSCKIVNIIYVLSKIKCTPHELSVPLTTLDAYYLHYLIEKYID